MSRTVLIGVGIVLLAGVLFVFYFFVWRKNARSNETFADTTVFTKEEVAQQYTSSLHGGKSEKEWKEILSELQFRVLHEEGTEAPFTSELLGEKRAGTYVTADCKQPVFRSEDKYDSGTGWPSFTRPISEDALLYVEDYSLGVRRIEVRGSKCNTHLGHVFPDGPPEKGGSRYCINGAALEFIPDENR